MATDGNADGPSTTQKRQKKKEEKTGPGQKEHATLPEMGECKCRRVLVHAQGPGSCSLASPDCCCLLQIPQHVLKQIMLNTTRERIAKAKARAAAATAKEAANPWNNKRHKRYSRCSWPELNWPAAPSRVESAIGIWDTVRVYGS